MCYIGRATVGKPPSKPLEGVFSCPVRRLFTSTFSRVRRWAALLCFFAGAAPCRAGGEFSLLWLPNLHLQYEGLGYRTVQNGWDIKCKPSGAGLGLRWRAPVSRRLALQLQYWRNQPFYAREDGNAASDVLRQTGQTRIALQALTADLRHPLAGSPWEAVAGLQGVHQTLHRKDIVYNLAPEPAEARERLWGLGAHVGAARRAPEGDGGYWEGELLLGHLFFTGNRLSTEGGSLRRDGYTYSFRLEAGWRRGPWRFGLGLLDQIFQVMVPGGRTLPGGAAASFPVNKTDFTSPFAAVTYAY
jgi:hypothetical protein